MGLLDTALGILSTYLDIDEYEAIEDSYGKIAYDIFNYLLVAKKAPYGNIVSVNKYIWEKSKKEKAERDQMKLKDIAPQVMEMM